MRRRTRKIERVGVILRHRPDADVLPRAQALFDQTKQRRFARAVPARDADAFVPRNGKHDVFGEHVAARFEPRERKTEHAFAVRQRNRRIEPRDDLRLHVWNFRHVLALPFEPICLSRRRLHEPFRPAVARRNAVGIFPAHIVFRLVRFPRKPFALLFILRALLQSDLRLAV